MPILQYRCKYCNRNFEELVKKYDQPVACPSCGKTAERCYCGEIFTATGTKSGKCNGHCATCGGCKH